MSEYQLLARKYRPQRFADVLGQDAIVTTLKNAVTSDHLANAYLFCGARGTGKTTLARILAKAINCEKLVDGEPCNTCTSCKEIAGGHSLDILEIDGASHRGIDDIRELNESVGYASSGKYKVYIIDEVHMLTKEAFNALLKTLEEPPANVVFFFATTEPHRVPATIISRCQRFSLSRITPELIVQKLTQEAGDLGCSIEPAALHQIAYAAEGGMRDAESILDQVVAFSGEKIDEQAVLDTLGLSPRSTFFHLDKAAQEQDLIAAFDIAEEVFTSGRDISHFVASLIEHYRTLLLITLGSTLVPETGLEKYQQSAAAFTKEQILHLLDDLIEMQTHLRDAPSKRVYLEMILTRVIRTPMRIPIESLVSRLTELEGKAPAIAPAPKATPQQKKSRSQPGRHDTIMRFAAVELEGRIEK